MDYEEQYKEDARFYAEIVERYRRIQEIDIADAYRLMKDSLVSYNRWSKIRFDIRKMLSRGQRAELKDRLEDMCKFLREINQEARMIWNQGKDDLRNNRGDV